MQGAGAVDCVCLEAKTSAEWPEPKERQEQQAQTEANKLQLLGQGDEIQIEILGSYR